MLLSLGFLALAIVLGWVFLRLTQAPMTFEAQVLWSVPLGTALLTLWIFSWAAAVRVQDWAVLGGSLSAAAGVLYFFGAAERRQAIAVDWRHLRKRWTWRDSLAWAIVGLPWLAYTALVVPRLLFFEDGNLIAGWTNVWADWAVHLRVSTFFSSQANLSLEHPLFAGTLFRYPYISGYLSATLQRLGASIPASLTWPTFVLFGTLPLQLYCFGSRVSRSRFAGVLFAYFILFAGGLGVVDLISDLSQQDFFWTASPYSPQLYTDVRNAQNGHDNTSIWFMNFIISEWFPQRAFLAGFPIALYILLSFHQSLAALTQQAERDHSTDRPTGGWVQTLRYRAALQIEEDIRHFPLQSLAIAGIIFGFLPLIHTHSYVALGIITAVMGAWYLVARSIKSDRESGMLRVGRFSLHPKWYRYVFDLAAFFLPAVGIGFSVLFVLLLEPDKGSSFHLIRGWVPQPDRDVNLAMFWLRNAGMTGVLGLLGGWLLPKSLRSLLLGAGFLFAICNIISFQAWTWDNLKLLTYWYVLWSLAAAICVTQIPRRLWLLQAIAIVLACAAGAADVGSLALTSQKGLQLASKTEVEFAHQVRQHTTASDLILNGPSHNHPISVLSGRRMVIGYTGWLWSYGIDFGQRETDTAKMYAGTTEGFNLLKQYRVTHVVVSPDELRRYEIDEAQWDRSFPTIVREGKYSLIQIEPAPT
ncbi:MAG: hypothetical protein AAFX40_02930 [Cyanobacteria bacterium J06639_1]